MQGSFSSGANWVEEGLYRGKPSVEKRYLPKPKTLKWWKYLFLKCLGFEVPIEYRSASERMHFERRTLNRWSKKGFAVPKVLSSTADSLILERVSGPTLQEHLLQASSEERLKAASLFFRSMRERHCRALFEGDRYLIQFDGNLRNTILTEKGFVSLDFEMGHFNEKIELSAVRELQKALLEIANLLGRERLVELADLARTDYGIDSVLQLLIKRSLARPLQSYHLRRDAKRKRSDPGRVTKVDLAHALLGDRKSLEEGRSLLRVEQTSWNGKQYQTLDDRSGGRKMAHRYRVMGFRSDFSGRSLLDIGCNLGRICLDAAKRGALRSVGIDHRRDVMEAMNRYAGENRLQASFYPFDINRGVEALKELIGEEPFDTVYILSIWSHVHWPSLAEIVNFFCKEECFFEDNAPSRLGSLEEIEKKLKADLRFDRCEFLGYTTDRGVRPVFRLARSLP